MEQSMHPEKVITYLRPHVRKRRAAGEVAAICAHVQGL